MEDKNWIDMLEKMQSIRYFSRVMIRRATKKYEIPAEHIDLLSQLSVRTERMTPLTLSKNMNLNKTIISRIIEQLHSKGYLIKIKDENDKRSYFVSITPLGEELLRKIYIYYLEPIYELRNQLGDEAFFNLMTCIDEANKKMHEHSEGVL